MIRLDPHITSQKDLAKLNTLVWEYKNSRDIRIQNQVLQSLIPLVNDYANLYTDRYPNTNADANNLFSEGIIGVTKGLNNLVVDPNVVDPTKNPIRYLSKAIKRKMWDCMKIDHKWDAWIGSDETGTSDYFGPIVVAGFYADPNCIKDLTNWGVTDSKKLKSGEIKPLAKKIRERYPANIAIAESSPEDINSSYSKENDQRHIMASLHANVINTLSTQIGVKNVITDQFCRENLLRPLIHPEIDLIEIPKAEKDIAVATASILARDRYLTAMEKLSQMFCIKIPKGSNAQIVVDIGKKIYKWHGDKRLKQVAKLHHKQTLAIRV